MLTYHPSIPNDIEERNIISVIAEINPEFLNVSFHLFRYR